MPTATPTAPPKAQAATAPSWDPWQDYLVSSRAPDYKGISAHQSFNQGVAQIKALPEDASDEDIRQRICDLEWLANAYYTVEEAEFLRVKRSAVVVEGAP